VLQQARSNRARTTRRRAGRRSGEGSPAVRIRAASLDDLDGLVALERSCFRGVYRDHRWDQRRFRYYLGEPRGMLAVADGEGGVEGYVAGYVAKRPGGPTALLYSLAVAPGARRRGIGDRLLQWFSRRARDAGCSSATLEVARSRREARRLFARHGFELIQRLPDHYAPGREAVRMRRQY